MELVVYQLNVVARIWFDQWKKGRAEGVPIMSWVVFESALMGSFSPRDLREAKVEEDKLRDREEFRNKKAKTIWIESWQLKSNANWSSSNVSKRDLLHQLLVHLYQGIESQGSVAEGGNGTYECAKSSRTHSGVCHDGSTGCFKCCQEDRAAPRGATSGTGTGGNRLYAITSHKKQENYLDVITVDCGPRVVKFWFPNELVVEWNSSLAVPKDHFISNLNARNVETPPIQSIPVVNEFPEVFLDDLPGVPLERNRL
ncbi:hypothetical protein H5410_002406 [Solanum commersonii]|uniref:Uncharacterized protein n=1 Tax=Solanum commersonii TaxID=4109 RepID=A0A9J6B1U6_SOLCO|nr:hypothetical protein H5410_002406 [Solanum commersonii]